MPSTMSNNIKMQYSYVILIYYIELRVTYNIYIFFFFWKVESFYIYYTESDTTS